MEKGPKFDNNLEDTISKYRPEIACLIAGLLKGFV